jgi:outer membrane biosynthesis protein TonB
MKVWRATVVMVVLTAALGLGGCKKKKPAVPAPQAQAPAVAPSDQPAPLAPPPSASGEPNRPQPPETAPAATAPPEPATKSKPKPRNHVAAKKPAPAPAPEKPSRTVVDEGGTRPANSGQLSASLPPDTAIHQKLNTAQLLEATDYNLKSVTRTLTSDEQAMVQHIRSYMQQSREASKDGDVERAYNLALKAHLLSDELVKR